MDSLLSFSVLELVILMLGAMILGFTIHFFILSSRTLKNISPTTIARLKKELEDRKLIFFNELDARDQEVHRLNAKLAEQEEKYSDLSIDAEEIQTKYQKVLVELQESKKNLSQHSEPEQSGSLKDAESVLREYQGKIGRMLREIDGIKESEKKQQALQEQNDTLAAQADELERLVQELKNENQALREKQLLTHDVNSMIDDTYQEFRMLQDKIKKLETQVLTSREINLNFEDLREEQLRLLRESEELKTKLNSLIVDKHALSTRLAETEDKLRESNFQRQQLQKKLTYMEELNKDMQILSETNKKLESQIRRINELESMLSFLQEQKNELPGERPVE